MKRRSRAGGELTKGRRRKAAEAKRRNAPKAPARSSSSYPETAIDVARLSRELSEALEQQKATSDLLQVISGSPGNLEPVFQAMLENAVGICGANFGNMFLYEDSAFRTVAMHNAPEAYANARKGASFAPPSNSALGRLVATREVVQVADLRSEERYINRDPFAVAGVELADIRTLLAVPMLKEGRLVGAIVIYRQEVKPFSEKQIELVRNFASQVVIAIENTRLLNELRQSLEQQTATSEVLQVISSSSGDLQPVFASILANATRICEADFGVLVLYENAAFQVAATHNAPPAFVELRQRQPTIRASGALARVVVAEQLLHISDCLEDASYKQGDADFVRFVDLCRVRSLILAPMLKDAELIGVIGIYRTEVRPFADKQIALVQNFANQAVIAIENARLLNELRQRTIDLTEALEQQTATSEVLQVISSSPGELEPVFAAMLGSATRICEAKLGNLFLGEGETFRAVAWQGLPTYYENWRREPLIINTNEPHIPLARLVETKQRVHIADLKQEAAYKAGFAPLVALVDRGGARTLLIVPMLKGHTLVGAIAIYRQEVRPFTAKQIALVENFAAQAVIAIENARLLNELRQRTTDLTDRTDDLTEALEQQTATSEVLQVISSSPGDLQPVFAAMLEKAVRICDATFGDVYRPHGDAIQLVAMQNTPPAFAEALKQTPHFRPSSSVGVRMVATKSAVQVTDLAADQDYVERRSPFIVAAVELGGVRTVLAVPMLKENELIGAFMLCRQEVRPFADNQIELVKNFAAQAVIAIENARLLNELRQSLEQQTATADVLQVISTSPGELEPVFQSLLQNATRVCQANFGNLGLCEGDGFRNVAIHNGVPTLDEFFRGQLLHPHPESPLSLAARNKRPWHIVDIRATPPYLAGNKPIVMLADVGGARAFLCVPMLKDTEVVGVIILYRNEVRPFTDKQIELVQNFAAQAVIAIENARLLKELRERTEEVEKLNQQLEQRVTDQVGEIERMGRLRRFLPPQVADLIVASGTEKQLESHRREITALFCDLRGFTGFSESADPEDVMTVLREYHEALGASIIKYSGTLERYAGDGVMVVFNDPVPVENPALQAVLMALEMRDAIGALTETWHRWGHDIGFGIGIAHGFATLGTIGFEGRFDYAAIGTVSNVASRLCDEAKPGQILISPRVLTKVENAVKVEPVGEFELKGIRRPLAAFNVVAATSVET
jgi:GAF domain-containing protein